MQRERFHPNPTRKTKAPLQCTVPGTVYPVNHTVVTPWSCFFSHRAPKQDKLLMCLLHTVCVTLCHTVCDDPLMFFCTDVYIAQWPSHLYELIPRVRESLCVAESRRIFRWREKRGRAKRVSLRRDALFFHILSRKLSSPHHVPIDLIWAKPRFPQSPAPDPPSSFSGSIGLGNILSSVGEFKTGSQDLAKSLICTICKELKHCRRHNRPMSWHHNWRYPIGCKFAQNASENRH